MPEKLSILVTLFQPMAVTITLVYAFGVSSRWIKADITRNVIMGLLFGFAAILSMELPMTLGDGVIVDLRNLFVGLAAGLFGWIAGLIAMTIGIAMRIYLGGAGALAGVVAMVLAVCGAMFWRTFVRHRVSFRGLNFVWLGVCISFHLAALGLIPAEFIMPFVTGVAPIILVCNLVGAILLGGMIHRENLLLTEAAVMREHAQTDPLTRLMNRRYLREVFDDLETDKTAHSGRAMLYFDLDGFKSINDTHGHIAGDEILKVVCSRVAACLRPQDLCSRLGGDEVLVVLPNIDARTARTVAERCRMAVAETPIHADGHDISVSISVGVSWATTPPSFIKDLAIADEALYLAKRSGRNCVTMDQQTAAA